MSDFPGVTGITLTNSSWYADTPLDLKGAINASVPTDPNIIWSLKEPILDEYPDVFDLPIDKNCDIAVRSLDGRLVSRLMEDGTIEYPILCLHRDPVREDAKNFKEVLVFRDRATNIRVTPQPVLLNEENNYGANAIIESNGNWVLYDYDRSKITCTLDSGVPVTAGSGNDILRIKINQAFDIPDNQGQIYELTLLFATDTSDEPYVVPVVIDLAVPLTVNGEKRKVVIDFGTTAGCEALNIVRDRAWEIVAFSIDDQQYFDMDVLTMSGQGDTVTQLCLLSETIANFIGNGSVTFIVSSGIKRVIVEAKFAVSSHFDVYKKYLLLEDSNTFTGEVYIGRSANIGTDETFGYTFRMGINTVQVPSSFSSGNTLGDYEILAECNIDDGEVPVEFKDVNYEYYDRFTFTYTKGSTDTVRTSSLLINKQDYFTFTAGAISARVDVYRNIERGYAVNGEDTRPGVGGGNWWFKRELGTEIIEGVAVDGYFSTSSIPSGDGAWLYIERTNGEPYDSASFYVTTNQTPTRAKSSTLTDESIQGDKYTYKSGLKTLRYVEDYVTLTFAQYYLYRHKSDGSGVENADIVPKEDITARYEVRHPHYFEISAEKPFLLVDNNWTQHHWCRTNPDAVIEVTDSSSSDITCVSVMPVGTPGNSLLKIQRPLPPDPIHDFDFHTVEVKSSVPSSLFVGEWLESPDRDIVDAFDVTVYHPVDLKSNEIVPTPDNWYSLGFDLTDGMTLADSGVFSRDNKSLLEVPFVGKQRLMSKSKWASSDRTDCASFIIEFPNNRIIRSWSYTVKGVNNIACGFLIEGQYYDSGSSNYSEWEPMSAVTDFNTHSSGAAEGTIIIDYVTVTPRPWKKLRITVTQVRDNSGKLVSPSDSVSGTVKVGQFQFYEGLPVLKRIVSSSVARGDVAGYRLNTYNSQVNYRAMNSSVTVASAVDGRLQTERHLSGTKGSSTAVEDYIGIGESNYRGGTSPNDHWVYQLIEGTSVNPSLASYDSRFDCMGISLPTPIKMIGVRYDTSVVEDCCTAGAIGFETSAVPITSGSSGNLRGSGSSSVGSIYDMFAIISAWNFLGVTSVAFNTNNLDSVAQADLTAFAKKAQKLLYGMSDSNPVRPGSMLLKVDAVGDDPDHRLVQYNSGVWENIGQDIIYRSPLHEDMSYTDLLDNNGAHLETIRQAWATTLEAQNRNLVAFTNPKDERRLLYDKNRIAPSKWYELPDTCGFRQHRGKQFYCISESEGIQGISDVLGVRAYVPGRADVARLGENNTYIQGNIGEIQLFEDFKGGIDIAFENLSIDGQEIYNGAVISTSGTKIIIQADGLRVNGNAVASSRIYAQIRQATDLKWAALSNITLEYDHTTTSVTLFYRDGGSNVNDRMIPFMTFLIVRNP